MSIFAQSNRTAVRIRREAVYGETPVINTGGAWSTLRITGESLNLDKKTVRSEIVRADRQNDALLYVGRNTAGDLSGELSFGDWDDLMCAALGANAWTVGGSSTSDATTKPTVSIAYSGGVGTLTITAAPSGNTSGTTWTALGVLPNTILQIGSSSHAQNNGPIYITSVSGAVATFLVGPGVTPFPETGLLATYHYEYLANSTSQPSFVVQKEFQDISSFAYYNGLYVDKMSVDITAMGIIKISFSLMGKDNVLSTVTVTGANAGHVLPSLSSVPVTASVNVGSLLLNGTVLSTGIKSMKFDTSNNLRIQEVVGSSTPAGFGYGSFEVKGSSDAYFQDNTLWALVLNHGNFSQFAYTNDPSGNQYGFGIPLSNFSKGSGNVGGLNQDVMLPLEWESSRDPQTNAMLIISRTGTFTA